MILIARLVEQQKIKSSRSFRIRTEYQPEEITLRADRIHLYSIISNLVDNAIKYADKEPEITIRAVATEGKDTQIRVQDNSPGIPEEYRRHIFDKFYRIPLCPSVTGERLWHRTVLCEDYGGETWWERHSGMRTR